MKSRSPRIKILTKRLSLFVSCVTIAFWLWVAYTAVFLGWVAYVEQDESGYGTYHAIWNGTHVADLQGIPLQDFTIQARWMAFGSTTALLILWIYSFCIRLSKKNSLDMNLLGDTSVKDFLGSISKTFVLLIGTMATIGASMIVTWLVLLKGDAYDPGTYIASSPWFFVKSETYQGLTLPPSCRQSYVSLGVHLIGNNPSLWPSTSCSTVYNNRVTTYFCCFAIEDVDPPRFSDHLYDYTFFGGGCWVAICAMFALGFYCTTWWKRQAVGSI